MANPNSSDTFNRPPRIQIARVEGEIDIPSPPKPADESTRNLLLSMLPMSGVIMMGVFYLVIGATSGRSPLMALPIMVMGGVSVLAAMLTYSYQKREQRRRTIKARQDYHRLLDKRAARLQAAREVQLYSRYVNFPPPERILEWAESHPHRLWARRPVDEDFGYVRLGEGEWDSTVAVKLPDPDAEAPDIRRAVDLVFEYRRVPRTSAVLSLLEWPSLGIVGHRGDTLAFVYALVTHLTAFHAPVDLNLYVFSSKIGYIAWNWTRWLPHTSSTYDGGFPSFIAYEPDHIRELADALIRRVDARLEAMDTPDAPHEDHALLVVVFDDASPIKEEVAYKRLLVSQQAGVIALNLGSEPTQVPGECRGVIYVRGDNRFRVELTGPQGIRFDGKVDMLTRAQVELFARQIANLKLPYLGASGRIPARLEFLQMYGAQSIATLHILDRWSQPVAKDGLLPFPVPIGNTSFSSQLMFHLAENIHGPHGVIAGTTGAGKSELLQTIVSSMAAGHHPYLVSFLLIDYKGGATFGIFKHLPHTVGLITNLNKIEALRALEAIKSENRRRQAFLNEKGFADITEYHKQLVRYGGQLPPDWEPLPHLCIIIDEFAELKTDLPNFLDELVATVRVGRSLGIHLILATQRPAGHVTEEMRANLQFRICLRVQNPEESAEVLRRPDAAHLPTEIIGRAFFQIGTNTQEFQVAYAGMAYDEQVAQEDDGPPPVLNLVEYEQRTDLLKKKKDMERSPAQQEGKPDASESKKLAKVLADYMTGLFRQMDIEPLAPVLLQSLPDRISLESVLADYRAAHGCGGWNGQTWREGENPPPWGCAPIGRVDNLNDRSQPPLLANLHESGGHLLVVGMSGTGKTSLLRTFVLSTAQLFTPEQAHIYILSFAGRALQVLEDVPHVGAVIFNDQHERIARLLHLLRTILDQRRRDFSMVGADDLENYNHFVKDRPGLNPHPAIFVLIDNFAELRESFHEESEAIIGLIRDGRSVGIHFVLTAPTIKLPGQVLALIEQRLVLRLSDKTDYMALVGRIGEREVNPRPGSGLLRLSPTSLPQHIQVALPTSGPADDPASEVDTTVDDGIRNQAMLEEIKRMKDAWYGAKPAPVHTLPESVPLDGKEGWLATALSAAPPSRDQAGQPPEHFQPIVTPVGLDGLTLQHRVLDWRREGPHFLVNGPVGSGKSSLLAGLLLGTAAQYAPDEVWVLLVDFSRSLRRFRNLPHVIDYVTDESSLMTNLAHFVAELNWRRQELESWQSEQNDFADDDDEQPVPFPPILIMIDDYDQMRDAIGSYDSPIDALGRSIRKDSHLGFHLIVAGETSNMSRGSDLLLKQLRLMRSGFGLVSAEAVELLGGRVTAAMRSERLPDGRGYHVTRNSARLMQFTHSIEPAQTLKLIHARWHGYSRAAWQHQANPDDIEALEQSATPPGGAPAPDMNSANWFDIGGALDDYKKQQGYEPKE